MQYNYIISLIWSFLILMKRRAAHAFQLFLSTASFSIREKSWCAKLLTTILLFTFHRAEKIYLPVCDMRSLWTANRNRRRASLLVILLRKRPVYWGTYCVWNASFHMIRDIYIYICSYMENVLRLFIFLIYKDLNIAPIEVEFKQSWIDWPLMTMLWVLQKICFKSQDLDGKFTKTYVCSSGK